MEQREPAVHVWISELLSGSFVQNEESPSSVTLPNGRIIYRARLYGIVVSNEELVVDDSTGSIVVRAFEQHFTANTGEPVLIIGRPRLYNNEPYILGEIVKRTEIGWLNLREKQHPRPMRADPREHALETVRALDAGDGADYDAVVARIGDKGEEIIVHMLAVGELFETKPGKLKVLE